MRAVGETGIQCQRQMTLGWLIEEDNSRRKNFEIKMKD